MALCTFSWRLGYIQTLILLCVVIFPTHTGKLVAIFVNDVCLSVVDNLGLSMAFDERDIFFGFCCMFLLANFVKLRVFML